MRISYISNGEKTKFRHHIDVKMPEGVTFFVPEEMSGCEEQIFDSSNLKSVIRFRFERLDINADLKTIRVWYAPYPKNFFKLSIRLEEPFIHNLKKIMDDMSSSFLKLPKELARGTVLDDIPGDITSKSVMGKEEYIPSPSRLTQELAEIMPDVENKIKSKKSKAFDYWVFDEKLINNGIVSTVGNENGTEFMRYYKIGSLPEQEIITAYVRPWFCKEYKMKQ